MKLIFCVVIVASIVFVATANPLKGMKSLEKLIYEFIT